MQALCTCANMHVPVHHPPSISPSPYPLIPGTSLRTSPGTSPHLLVQEPVQPGLQAHQPAPPSRREITSPGSASSRLLVTSRDQRGHVPAISVVTSAGHVPFVLVAAVRLVKSARSFTRLMSRPQGHVRMVTSTRSRPQGHVRASRRGHAAPRGRGSEGDGRRREREQEEEGKEEEEKRR